MGGMIRRLCGGGGPCDFSDSLSPKIWNWDFRLRTNRHFGTSDSGRGTSD